MKVASWSLVFGLAPFTAPDSKRSKMGCNSSLPVPSVMCFLLPERSTVLPDREGCLDPGMFTGSVKAAH